jgi:predicted nucleotidyltransferase
MNVPEPGQTEAISRAIQAYLNAVAQLKIVSVILFGSAAQGSFTAAASDVDLILLFADGASRRIGDELAMRYWLLRSRTVCGSRVALIIRSRVSPHGSRVMTCLLSFAPEPICFRET